MKTLGKTIFAFLYTAVYIVLAIDSTGAGHSTFIFLTPLPTWILALMAFGLSSRVTNPTIRIGIPTLLTIHYLVTAVSILSYVAEGSELLTRRWRMSPDFVSLIIVWYFVGQLVIWFTFVLEVRRANTLNRER